MPYCNPMRIRDAALKLFRVGPAQGASLLDGPRQQMIHKRLFSSSTVNEHPFWDKLIGCRPTVEISCRRKRVPALLTRSCPSERKYLISARSIIVMHLPGVCPGRSMKIPARTTSVPCFAFLRCIIRGKFFRCPPIRDPECYPPSRHKGPRSRRYAYDDQTHELRRRSAIFPGQLQRLNSDPSHSGTGFSHSRNSFMVPCRLVHSPRFQTVRAFFRACFGCSRFPRKWRLSSISENPCRPREIALDDICHREHCVSL